MEGTTITRLVRGAARITSRGKLSAIPQTSFPTVLHVAGATPTTSGQAASVTCGALSGASRKYASWWGSHAWRHTGHHEHRRLGDEPDHDHDHGWPCRLQDDQRYIVLVGVVFSDEVARLSDWYGTAGTKSRYGVEAELDEVRLATAIERSTG